MKYIYIAHPVGGNVKKNLKKVVEIVREVAMSDPSIIPVAPYYLLCKSLDDNDEKEREIGMRLSLAYLKEMKSGSEIWLYGDKISKGMREEITVAESKGFKVVCKSENTAANYKKLIHDSSVLTPKDFESIGIELSELYYNRKRYYERTSDGLDINQNKSMYAGIKNLASIIEKVRLLSDF